MPYVYMCIHKQTQQFYIGSRTSKKIKEPSHLDFPKYKTSSNIVKYDFDSYNWFIVAEFLDNGSAYEFEQKLIRENWLNEKLLNGTVSSGDGYKFICPLGAITAKDQQGNAFRVLSTDSRWISGELVGVNTGRKQTTNEIKNRAKSNTGKGKAAIEVNTGKHLGKIPNSDIRWITGEIIHVNKNKKKPKGFSEQCKNRMLGRSLSDETKRKLRELNLGKNQSTETKNKRKETNKAQNRLWMNNTKINKRIPEINIDQFIEMGWNFGRIKWKRLDI